MDKEYIPVSDLYDEIIPMFSNLFKTMGEETIDIDYEEVKPNELPEHKN